MTRRPQWWQGAFLFILLTPTTSTADPIQLPSFTASVRAAENWETGPIYFDLTAPSVTFSGETARELQPGRQLSPCYPFACAPGTAVDFSGTSHRFGFQGFENSLLAVGGELFHIRGMDAVFVVVGPPVKIPPVVNGLAEVSAPVNVTASLTALLYRNPLEEAWPLELLASGQGTAHMLLRRPPLLPGEECCLEWLDEVTIRFAATETAAPVPEPSTLLLLISGGAAIARRVQVRRRSLGSEAAAARH